MKRAACGTKRRLPRRASTRPRPRTLPRARALAGTTPWSPRRRRTHWRWRRGGALTGRGATRAALQRNAPHARVVCGLTHNLPCGFERRLPHRPLTRAAPPPVPSGAHESRPRARLLVNCGWLGGRRTVWLSGGRRDSRPLPCRQCPPHSVASHFGGGVAAATIHLHGLQNSHPNGCWMGIGCLLVSLWMGTDGLFQPIQAHPTEFWMGDRWALDGLWMGVSSRWRSPSSALECADSRGPPEGQRVMHGRRGRFRHARSHPVKNSLLIGHSSSSIRPMPCGYERHERTDSGKEARYDAWLPFVRDTTRPL